MEPMTAAIHQPLATVSSVQTVEPPIATPVLALSRDIEPQRSGQCYMLQVFHAAAAIREQTQV